MSEVNPHQGTTKQAAADQIAEMPDELFGDLLEGAEPEEVEEEVKEETEVTEEEAEPEQETEQEAEPKETEEAEQDSEPTEELELNTVNDMAEALGLENNELLDNLKTTIKVDGQESEVTLSELKSGYQKDADYRRKTAEVAEQRNQLKQEVETYQQEFQQKHVELGQFLNAAEQMIVADANSVEMETLRQTNPAEWNARMFEYQQKQGNLNALRQQAAQQWQANQDQLMQQTQEQQKEILEKESTLLKEKLPDFENGLKQEILTYMVDNYSLPKEQLLQITDHNFVLLAHKAMQWDKAQAETNVTKKKVKTLPKVQKPSKPETKVTVKRKKLDAAKSRLKKTGHRKDAANLILESGLLDKI